MPQSLYNPSCIRHCTYHEVYRLAEKHPHTSPSAASPCVTLQQGSRSGHGSSSRHERPQPCRSHPRSSPGSCRSGRGRCSPCRSPSSPLKEWGTKDESNSPQDQTQLNQDYNDGLIPIQKGYQIFISLQDAFNLNILIYV